MKLNKNLNQKEFIETNDVSPRQLVVQKNKNKDKIKEKSQEPKRVNEVTKTGEVGALTTMP